jgi:3',5'-cyclic AMP phosphodiesterase CpdA
VFVRSDDRSSVTVWAVGDGADGNPAAARVARLIARSKPDRLLYLGDVYEEGTAEEYARNYAPIYGGLGQRTAPTPGNHEWPNHTTGYDPYWERVYGRKIQHYYSFETGGWQILSLNSQMPHDSGSAQVRWLRAATRSDHTCRLAFWHRPRFSAGEHHGDQVDVQPFWQALAGRAAIVLNGHEHDMQRFRPRDGITEFVSGAGGRRLYAIDMTRKDLAFADDEQYGALRLELARGSAAYQFVSAGGRVLDSGNVRCRAG